MMDALILDARQKQDGVVQEFLLLVHQYVDLQMVKITQLEMNNVMMAIQQMEMDVLLLARLKLVMNVIHLLILQVQATVQLSVEMDWLKVQSNVMTKILNLVMDAHTQDAKQRVDGVAQVHHQHAHQYVALQEAWITQLVMNSAMMGTQLMEMAVHLLV